MGFNVIDDQKLQSALTGVTDAAAKQIATQVLPVVGALVDSAVTKLCSELEATVGGGLNDITAERTEIVNDTHAILDRINGATLEVRLTIPPRKETPA